MDSFDDRFFTTGASYSTYHAKWNTVNEDSGGGYLLEQVDGYTGKAAKLGGGSYLEKTGFGAGNFLTWGLRINVPSTPSTAVNVVTVSVTHSGGLDVYKYQLQTNLYMKILNNNNTDLITSITPLELGKWYYLESLVNADTVSSISLKKDGVNWLSSDNIAATSYVEPNISGFGISGGVLVDDLYLSDQNTAPLGNIRIYAAVPNGNGTARGTNPWQNIDFNDVNECYQANFNPNDYDESSTTSPTSISYDFENVSNNTVQGVQLLSWVAAYQKSGSPASIGFSSITRISGTDYPIIPGLTLSSSGTTSYNLLRNVWATSPATSSAWGSTEFNDSEFGLRVSNVDANNVGLLSAITAEVALLIAARKQRMFLIS